LVVTEIIAPHPPYAAEFEGNVPVVQTEAWQALKPAKHEQLLKLGCCFPCTGLRKSAG
jgi:hypothetical protein